MLRRAQERSGTRGSVHGRSGALRSDNERSGATAGAFRHGLPDAHAKCLACVWLGLVMIIYGQEQSAVIGSDQERSGAKRSSQERS